MEAEAALHVAAVDPDLGVALPWRAAATGRRAGPARRRPGLLRAEWSDGEVAHWVRAYDVLPGHSRIEAAALSDAALIAWGETTARLALALRGVHPPAGPPHDAVGRPARAGVAAAARATSATRPSARWSRACSTAFERTRHAGWPRLRAQVVHTDLTVDNTLTDDDGLITGIIDFGDMSHSALITDLASVLDSLGVGRAGDELFRAGPARPRRLPAA